MAKVGLAVNSAIELHDSDISSVTIVDQNAIVKFGPAYVHKSIGSPGIDQGEVWLQDAEMIVSDPKIVSDEQRCGGVCDGYLRCGGKIFNNVIAVPLEIHCESELAVEFKSGKRLVITGPAVRVRTITVGTYLEDFKTET